MIGIVLAGGSGTRFWPMSRKLRPKQLVSLWDDKPMIAATIDRLAGVSSRDKTFVVLGEHLVDATRAALPGVEFIVEPCPRNTAPAIGLAAVFAQHRFGDEPIGIFPADHAIGRRGVGGLTNFERCLKQAEEQAEAGHLVTLGITPTSPETGYGYIHYTESDAPAHPVREFVEKPSRAVAQQYLESGDYVWNSGIFVFKPSVLLAEMQRQLPEMHEAMMEIAAALGTDEEAATIDRCFSKTRGISIDYGVMENAANVVVIPATFHWSDVGHWDAVDVVSEVDPKGNVVEADALLLDVSDSVIYSQKRDRLIAVCGVDDLVVVDTDDALLIIDRKRAQDVKKLVEALKEAGRDDLL